MSSDVIRNVDIEDFDSIYLLLKQLWPNKELSKVKLFKIHQLSIDNKTEYSVCYIKDNNIVGFAAGNIQNSLYRAGRLCYVAVLVVDFDYRGQGIGTKLMDYIKTIAADNDCIAIQLESGFHREKAHTFYEKSGFTKTAYSFALEL